MPRRTHFDTELQLELDEGGFLIDAKQWNNSIACKLAARENIVLQDAHWDIISHVQNYYTAFDLSPAMRPLIKYLQLHLGAEINSVYLLKLFPGNPAIIASKIAGLPKPENCF